MKTNFHSHNVLCKHAHGTLEDYVVSAIEKGYTSLGFSDHGPLTGKLKDELYSLRMNEAEFYNIYLPECNRLIEKYKDKIKLYKGVEIEYFEEMMPNYAAMYSELDYMILGQHYYHYQNDYISTYQQMDDLRLNAFVCDTIAGLDTGYFKILAHPDIFMMGYPFFDIDCVEASKKIIEACIRNNVLIEINANGIRNCEHKKRYTIETKEDGSIIHRYAYPNYNFFKIASTYKDAKFILNDDSHNPTQFDDESTKEAINLCNELGIKLENDFSMNH